MLENSLLGYSVIALAVLGSILIFSRFRTSYVKSLHDSINAREEQLGQTINQLAAVKTMNQSLEQTITNQSQQIEEMVVVNKKHSESLSKSYQDSKQLIADYKQAQKIKSELEEKLKSIEESHQAELEEKFKKLTAFEAAYRKLKNSYKIVQKSNENLCEERDFYREEFIKLRKSVTDEENVVQMKTA